jgi:phage portal protein BeeE
MFKFDTDTSDMKTLEESAKNLMCILEARGEIIRHRGALGMITPESGSDGLAGAIAGSDGKKDLLSQLKKMYGILRGQSQVIVPDYPVKWQKMSMSIAELRLAESQTEEVNTCCDLLSVPRELFDPSTTFDNKEQARLKMYQDTVIPWAYSDITRLNAKMGLASQGLYYAIDYTHLQILQESEKDREATLKAKSDRLIALMDKGIIAIEDVQAELGYITKKKI